ncbi:MAG TPA: nickel pincer cofactor biosynthesis protein LarB [bacterium]|nr:nickel pincer cofactor biosynthesis protein LarB [Candidatus Omnitrophota bacterium]HOJ59999.1 nickel pincer cofactor biosynthesis protein LarB [bacterium]HOL93744.1 nickel pincer cofactor biosynthesis protein LarB [bacterium]HPP01265.1 nickel pincer cofactor biosynthesis protein LarB [bacterium]
MNQDKLRELLDQVRCGSLPVEKALAALKHLPYEDVGFATIDHHRSLRQGVPEVIFCQNKTTDEIIAIIHRLRDQDEPVLATRTTPETFAEIQLRFPEACFYERSRAFTLGVDPDAPGIGNVLVICAGTSDLPVAEEAVVTARFTGSNVTQLTDVGVAGLHRLLSRLDVLHAANAVVVVAGMEGALASVVGGLVDIPVIAVPTSVGYGASFGGLAALLTMLNSCSAGVTVVNIDNGFGAGFAASLINRKINLAQREKRE